MLILTRKTGEAIMLGSDIKVTVVSLEHGQVRLGIEAPRSVAVHRQEIFERIQEENIQAAKAEKKDLSALSKLFSERKKKS